MDRNMDKSSSSSSPFRSDCLANKVAFVTGGGSGIGFEITRQLLLHGCSAVTICGRRESFLQEAARALSRDTGKIVLYVVCDVRDSKQCKAAIEYAIHTTAFQGRLDILVNGAAGNFLADAGNALKPKGFQTVMEIDAQGTYNMSYWALEALKQSAKQGSSGCIINISATLHYGATFWQTHASAAKAAVDSVTRSLALEWGEYNIRVNGIAPGPIANTPGTMKLAPTKLLKIHKPQEESTINNVVSSVSSHENPSSTKEKERIQGIPIGRMGHTLDVAYATVFLASDHAASFITGHTLVVDGGQYMYRPPIVPRDKVSKFSSSVERESREKRPDLVSKL